MRAERQIRVLLVDDDPATLQMYRMALEGTAEVMTESSPARAVEQATNIRPDVIVLDLAMPAVDGWQLCHALSNDVATSGLPVLVLTGHDDAEVPAKAIKAGVRAVLNKPCPIDRFLLAIRAAAEVGTVERHQQQIRRLYDFFNDRRFAEAAAMFHDNMRGFQHPLRREGYIAFANGWVGAFPDAWMTVVSIVPQSTEYHAHVMAVGTHLGDLSFANGEILRPAKRPMRIAMRNTFRFDEDRIVSSTLSFDSADLTQQLERPSASSTS
jgi:CheY-like chemotaxis protein